MNVSAVLVTRGDVDLDSILESLPEDWEKVVWNNGEGSVDVYNGPWARKYGPGITKESWPARDLKVYGRYAAIERATGDLIYVQDDDCVLSDPQGIVDAWYANRGYEGPRAFVDHVVCNMPANFRARHFYDEHSLVGFGACFHRNAPARAFTQFMEATGRERRATSVDVTAWEMDDLFLTTCDIVFTALTPRVLVDVPYDDLPWASADNRMWKQSWHQSVRDEMLATCKEVLHARSASA